MGPDVIFDTMTEDIEVENVIWKRDCSYSSCRGVKQLFVIEKGKKMAEEQTDKSEKEKAVYGHKQSSNKKAYTWGEAANMNPQDVQLGYSRSTHIYTT